MLEALSVPNLVADSVRSVGTETKLANSVCNVKLGSGHTSPATEFEAMILSSFVKSLLPNGTVSVYGDGLAGEMWHGLLADKIAGQLAESGSLGISNALLAAYDDRTGNSSEKLTVCSNSLLQF
jgi:hypothetical protein